MQNLVLAKRPTRLLAFLAITPRWPRLLALLSSAGVRAQVTGYTLATNAGVALAPMTDSTQLLGAGIDDTPSALANIGFAFTFSGTSSTQFSVTPDGFLKFGSPAAASLFTNALASATNIPKLAPY